MYLGTDACRKAATRKLLEPTDATTSSLEDAILIPLPACLGRLYFVQYKPKAFVRTASRSWLCWQDQSTRFKLRQSGFKSSRITNAMVKFNARGRLAPLGVGRCCRFNSFIKGMGMVIFALVSRATLGQSTGVTKFLELAVLFISQVPGRPGLKLGQHLHYED